MREIIRTTLSESDSRIWLYKLICKLFHTDERFIDVRSEYSMRTIAIGHKCFNGTFILKDMKVENEFKDMYSGD